MRPNSLFRTTDNAPPSDTRGLGYFTGQHPNSSTPLLPGRGAVALKTSISQVVTCCAMCKAQSGLLPFLFPLQFFITKACFLVSPPVTEVPQEGFLGALYWEPFPPPPRPGKPPMPSLFLLLDSFQTQSSECYWAECHGQEWQQGPGLLPPRLKVWAHCPVLKTLTKEEKHF